MSGSLPRRAHNKIHALVDKKGRPIKLKLTAGQASDVASAPEMIADLLKDAMLIADKGYDANSLRRVGEHSAQSQSQAPDLLQQISLSGAQSG
jgi:transposase